MESVVKRCRGDEAEEGWRRKRQVSAEEVRSEVTDDNGGGEVTSSSRIVLEIPEHVATSGIRKITLKLKKRNDQRSNVVDVPLTSVKKLFATGILDGARVKYVSPCQQNVLDAVITGGGYLCGCSSCNFSRVVNAHEFERHAGVTTRHPNNHIYLENGKPVYSFLRHLKTAPFPVIADFLNRRHREQEEEDEEEDNHTSRLIAAPKQHYKKTAEPSTRRRDNDLHRLLFMPNGLPDGAELAYFVKGQRMLGGYKHGNGILCNCCNKEISPSQFEAHAGMAARRQPYRHIYTSNGLTLHDIAISLSAGQKLTMGDSDDMCAVCGDGGDLILCRGCPRAFHSACLDLPSVPQHEWHCPNCKDKFDHGKRTAGGESSATPRPIVIKLTRVVKAPEMDIGGCVVCRGHDFSAAKFDERTVMLCDQCEKEYHVGCLRESGLCDLKEIPKDKWFCCDDCNRIYNTLQNSVSIGPDIVPASLSDMIFKKYTDKGLSLNGVADDIQWRILSGKSRNSEHLPLLSRSAAIFRECFDPIVAKSGRDLIPVMVYGRNISGQEFGGMYCVVLIVRSIVVSAGLVRIFGREVAELPLVATSREHQGKGYFQALFWCIERLLSSLKVENIVLPAAEEAESIWTNKFGFTKMSEERVAKYMREVQFTIFKGTSMLEKVVQSCEVQN